MNKLIAKFLMLYSAFFFVPIVMADIDIIKMAQQLNPILHMQMRAKPEAEKLAKLDAYEQQIKAELAVNPNKVELHWLLGLHAWAKLYAWDKPVPIEKNRAQKAIASEAFRKAVELDDAVTPSLSIDMLYSIKKFAPSDVHVEVGHRILKQNKKLVARDELELRGGMATHYISLGKYDEAVRILKEWAEKYPDKENKALGYIKHAQKMIEEAQQKKLAVTEKPTDEPKEKPVVTKQTKTTDVKPPEQQTQPKATKPNQGFSFTNPWYLPYLIAVMIVVLLYVLSRAKKK